MIDSSAALLRCERGSDRAFDPLVCVKASYCYLIVGLTLTLAIASFVRDRGQLQSNVSVWMFAISFVATLVSTRLGLLSTVLLLTVGPSLHEQLNAVAGTRLHAWANPGVDGCLGFLAAWAVKGKLPLVHSVFEKFPSGPLLLLHAWITLSAFGAVAHNVWQSGSEISLRGVLYNVWFVRSISWHDDYYPLYDAFFCTVAVVMVLSVWTIVLQQGRRASQSIVLVLLGGTMLNVAFAIWQKGSGRGWVNGALESNVNAFWPDLHSFGALTVLSLFAGLGLLKTQSKSSKMTAFVVAAMACSAMGLYLSGSRFPVFVLSAGLVVWSLWKAVRLTGWGRLVPLAGVAFVLLALDWTLTRGYRGFTYESLRALTSSFETGAFNAPLSHRPEIWSAALRMYSEFPFFGLGQGAFYRLSVIPEFSRSEILVRFGGENAHNFFLQTFIELGPIGFALIALCVLPMIREGSRNLQFVSFYALAAVVIGNIYGHALLVREMLMLCAIFVGVYYGESQPSAPRVNLTSRRVAAFALVCAAFLALYEFAHSFNRFPFTFGQRCFEPRPIASDGWTGGHLRQLIPKAASRAEVSFSAEHPDMSRRPLRVDVSVADANGNVAWARTVNSHERPTAPIRFEIDVPEQNSVQQYLTIKTSHCFVPLNAGLGYDPRRLGVRVTKLLYFSKSGETLK